MTFSALPYTPTSWKMPGTFTSCLAMTTRPSSAALPSSGVGGDNSWGAKPHADACFAVEGMTFVLHPKAEWIIEKDQSGGAYQRLHSGLLLLALFCNSLY